MILHNKRALIGGATQGIGKATAVLLAEQGAEIVALSRTEANLIALMDELPRTAHQQHSFIVADHAQPSQLKTIVEAEIKRNPVHLLVNNSGGPPAGPVTDANLEQFLAAFQSHLLANHVLMQAVVPGMKALQYGRIVNVISTSVKQPLKNLGVSNTVRAAVANWSKTLAAELAPNGITVNNVLPGATLTQRLSQIITNNAAKKGVSATVTEQEMLHEIPMARFAKPEEIAAAVAFLVSPMASYITGINLPVDGGRTLSL